MADHIKFHSAYPTVRHTEAEADEDAGTSPPKISVEVTTHLDRDGYFKPSFSIEVSKGSYMSQKSYFDIDALDVIIDLLLTAKSECEDYKSERMAALIKEKEILEGEIEKQAEALEKE